MVTIRALSLNRRSLVNSAVVSSAAILTYSGGRCTAANISESGDSTAFAAVQSSARRPGDMLWEWTPEGGVNTNDGRQTPITDNDHVYLSGDGMEDSGILPFYALETATGAIKWKTDIYVDCQPISFNNAIFLAGVDPNNVDPRAPLYSLDTKNGDRQWSFLPDNAIATQKVIPVSDTVIGVLYGDQKHWVYALEISSGQLRWEFTPDDDESYLQWVSAGEDIVVVSEYGENEVIRGFELATGKQLWSIPSSTHEDGPAVVADGKVYLIEDDQVIAIDATTGTNFWLFPCERPIGRSLSVANGSLYFFDETSLHAVETTSGRELWQKRLDGFEMKVANETIYATDDLALYAINALSGDEVWKSESVRGRITPAVSDGVTYAIDDEDTALHAFDATSGAALWRHDIDTGSTGYPRITLGKGVVFVTGYNGAIYAIAAEQTRAIPPSAGNAAVTTKEADLMAAPLATADVLATLPNGTAVYVTDEPAPTGGIDWWPVIAPDGTEGWIDGTAIAGLQS